MRRRVLYFLVTPRQNCCWHRYAGVGIFVDGAIEAAAMTPNPYKPGRKVFDMLAFKTAILIQNILLNFISIRMKFSVYNL